MAGLLRSYFRHLHKIVEVSAAASARARHQVRAEAMADWRDSIQDWTIILSLLVSVALFKRSK